MKVPVYVITGFLDAGKTTLLKNLLNNARWGSQNLLVIQFESGVEEFYDVYNHCHKMKFSKRQLDQEPQYIVSEMERMIADYLFDEIWVEWNSMTSFRTLLSILYHPHLSQVCSIKKVLHLADANQITSLLGRTGTPLLEQIAESNIVLLRNADDKKTYKNSIHDIRGLNPKVDIMPYKNTRDVILMLQRKGKHPFHILWASISVFLLLFIFFSSNLEMQLHVPITTIVNIFIGYLLQGIPFLMIGVLLSSIIQIFVSQELIQRYFPKSFGLGMLFAILGGFCLPVCDCASIPIFRSLIKKGIPLSVAITFLMVTPIINPVVILSTYYAYNGDLSVVITRMLLGIFTSVCIGLSFHLRPPKQPVLSGGMLEMVMCNCDFDMEADRLSVIKKIDLLLRHSKAEFFNVGSYLIIGTGIAAAVQAMKPALFNHMQGNLGVAISIGIMMLMAFLLSLCSSSDAFVSRGFWSQFPASSIMGFLVFGPMMDIKNIMMLSYAFTKPFIVRLFVTTVFTCFIIIFAYAILL